MVVGWVGEPGCLLRCCALPAVVTSGPPRCPLCASTRPGVSHRVYLSLREKVVPVLGFADNVLCNLKEVSKRGKVWEVKGKQPGLMALFLCMECWLSDNRGCTSMLCPCLGHWLSRSSYCSLLQECSLNLCAASGWRECQPQPDSSPFWAESCSELPAAGFAPTYPPLGVSMHRSLKRVYALTRESFVEL